MGTTTTPNMSLTVPGIGTEPSPNWASEINNDLSILDAHTHSPGSGVQVTASGLNINSDLPFGNNNATQLRSTRFQLQTSPLTGSSSADIGCLYGAGVDLYFNDGNGNQVRLTQSGGVAGAPGAISNLSAPASAQYVSANSSFVWQSGANIAANLDSRNVILRNSSASSKGLTLSPPSSMAADITQTLPTIPATTSFMTMTSGGSMATSISTSQGITLSMQATANFLESSSSGTQSNPTTSPLNVLTSGAFTTVGRPVKVMVVPDGTSANSSFQANNSSAAASATLSITRDNGGGEVTMFKTGIVSPTQSGSAVELAVPVSFLRVDNVSAGTYTYRVYITSGESGTTCLLNHAVLQLLEE